MQPPQGFSLEKQVQATMYLIHILLILFLIFQGVAVKFVAIAAITVYLLQRLEIVLHIDESIHCLFCLQTQTFILSKADFSCGLSLSPNIS
jgi:hypothetical protein